MQVLNIYINQLGNLDLAEVHCSTVHAHAISCALEKKNGVIKGIARDEVRTSDNVDSNNQTGRRNGHYKGTGGEVEGVGIGVGVNSAGDASIYLCLLKILLTSVASCKPIPISVHDKMKTLSSSPPSSSPSSSSSTSSYLLLPQNADDHDVKDTEKTEINAITKLKNNSNNGNFKIDDIIGVAERCHDKIDTIAFLSLLPKNIPLYQIEKYLRLVLEFGNHKKRNLMVRTHHTVHIYSNFNCYCYISDFKHIISFHSLLILFALNSLSHLLLYFSPSLLSSSYPSLFFFSPLFTSSLLSQIFYQLLRVREVSLRISS